MAIEQVFTWLAIFIWVGLGAIIVLAAWMVVERKRRAKLAEAVDGLMAEKLGRIELKIDSGELSRVVFKKSGAALVSESTLNPHASLLGKPCWMNEGGDYSKFRIVAVSHKGSIAVRRWDDYSGKHAKWVRRSQIEKGYVYFKESEI